MIKFLPWQMDPLLGVLPHTIHLVVDLLVSHHLHTFAIARLLKTMSRYHVQLTNAVLENIN